jgi:hypothetical protein
MGLLPLSLYIRRRNMKLKVISDFYMGNDLIKAGTVIDVDRNTLKKCLEASVGVVEKEDGDMDGTNSDSTSESGTDDTGGSKTSAKNRRK